MLLPTKQQSMVTYFPLHEQNLIKETNDSKVSANGEVPPAAAQKTTRTKKPLGTRLPTDWKLTEEYIAAAKKLRPTWGLKKIEQVADEFYDYWISASGQKATKCDWLATWRNWVRRDLSGDKGWQPRIVDPRDSANVTPPPFPRKRRDEEVV